jgi:hypothetical protein
MKTQTISVKQGLGPMVCIMMESNSGTIGNTPGTIDSDDSDVNETLQDEENLIKPGQTLDETMPAGEEENMPDPEEFEERQGDENLDDIPMEEPLPDLDEIEPDEEIDDLDIDPTEDDDTIEDDQIL